MLYKNHISDFNNKFYFKTFQSYGNPLINIKSAIIILILVVATACVVQSMIMDYGRLKNHKVNGGVYISMLYILKANVFVSQPSLFTCFMFVHNDCNCKIEQLGIREEMTRD